MGECPEAGTLDEWVLTKEGVRSAQEGFCPVCGVASSGGAGQATSSHK